MASIKPSVSRAAPLFASQDHPAAAQRAEPTPFIRQGRVDTYMFRNEQAADNKVRVLGNPPLEVFFKSDEPQLKPQDEQLGLIAKVQQWLGKLWN